MMTFETIQFHKLKNNQIEKFACSRRKGMFLSQTPPFDRRFVSYFNIEIMQVYSPGHKIVSIRKSFIVLLMRLSSH